MMTGEPMMPGLRVPKPEWFSPEPIFPEGHPWAGKPRCQAWSGNNARQCNRIPVKGRSVCRSHGGTGGRPPKHGKFAFPARFAAAYRELLADPGRFDLLEAVALIDTSIQYKLDILGELGGIADHEEVLRAASAIQRGVERRDLDMCRLGLDRLMAAVKRTGLERHTWESISKDIGLVRRLSNTERKWITLKNQMIPANEVADMVSQISLIVCRHVQDPKVKSAIFEEIRALLPSQDQEAQAGLGP